MHRSKMMWAAAFLAVNAAPGSPVAAAAALKTVYTFTNISGSAPEDGPIDLGGTLVGTTVLGGPNGSGVIYKVDPATGAETVLYAFQGGLDGAQPEGGVVYASGYLYGATYEGGTPTQCSQYGCGTIFKVNIKTGAETVLYRFTGGADGANPGPGKLVYQNGVLYGTTQGGGDQGLGTVYAFTTSTGAETVLHSFAGNADGLSPRGGLTYENGMLYGLTLAGGGKGSQACQNVGCGTAFVVDTASGAERVLHAFTGHHDGAEPFGHLAYHGGKLYGTAYEGPAPYGLGVIFRIDTATGAEHTLYEFKGAPDGKYGDGVIYDHGILYGTTITGGSAKFWGTVYSFDLKTQAESVLYSFKDGSDGDSPFGTLLYKNGSLFGTTLGDGSTCNCGTLFQLTP